MDYSSQYHLVLRWNQYFLTTFNFICQLSCNYQENLQLLSAVDHYIWDQCLTESGLQQFPQILCWTFVSTMILLFSGHTPFWFPSIFEFPGTSLTGSGHFQNTVSCQSWFDSNKRRGQIHILREHSLQCELKVMHISFMDVSRNLLSGSE